MNGLGVDSGTGAIPLGKSSVGTTGDIPERGIGGDLEESVIHFLVIWLKFALHVDDENGRQREKTYLPPGIKDKHENRGDCERHSQRLK